jgi:hypothetical protein
VLGFRSGASRRCYCRDCSRRIRKRIEEVFGWTKTSGGMRKSRHRGKDRVGWMFTLTATAYNLARLPKLLTTA